MSIIAGTLVLSDGSTFDGEMVGADAPNGVVTGEVVFNTVMTGYQEVISDPSYAGQIVTFTTAHLGNYGVNAVDDEAESPRCRGVIIREMARRHSNWRAEGSLDRYLRDAGISGLAGVDTRRLTRRIRDHGALPAAFGTAPVDDLVEAARNATGTDGVDLVSTVTTRTPFVVPGEAGRRIVAIDCGIKTTIVRCLAALGEVHVVPAGTSAADVLAMAPDGVFISNGPGDPAAVSHVTETITELLGRVPIFGICMGHQLLATALGARTHKLAFGHHGGNHPVRDLTSGRVEITAQNHNYCVDLDGVDDVEATHVNLNDGTLEGFRSLRHDAFGIQYHPEAGPGPHDSRYLFDRFVDLMESRRESVRA